MPQLLDPSGARRSPLAESAAKVGRPLRLAHRGLYGAPRKGAASGEGAGPAENSIAAFLAADEAGLDGIECDLRVSSDGETMVVHDVDLQRTHGSSLLVATTSARDLSAHGIARIEELLAATPSSLLLDLELKEQPAPSLFAALQRARRGPSDGVVFSSFDFEVLAALRDSAPEWSCWLNVEGSSEDVIDRAQEAGCVGVAVDSTLCDQRFVATATAAGLEVAVWTLRTPEDLLRLARGEWSSLVAACVEGAAAVAAG